MFGPLFAGFERIRHTGTGIMFKKITFVDAVVKCIAFLELTARYRERFWKCLKFTSLDYDHITAVAAATSIGFTGQPVKSLFFG